VRAGAGEWWVRGATGLLVRGKMGSGWALVIVGQGQGTTSKQCSVMGECTGSGANSNSATHYYSVTLAESLNLAQL
jgi:hypothetical protein